MTLSKPLNMPTVNRRHALAGLIACSLAVAALAAFMQVMLGSYEMTWHRAWAAMTDPNVWQPSVWVRLLCG